MQSAMSPLLTASRTPRGVALACFYVVVSLGCSRERPVEAPVTDVNIGPLDASAQAFMVERAPPASASEQEVPGMAGRWEGIGRQDDGQTWALVVDLSSTRHGVCATADYPTVPCRAQWICTREEEGELRAREQLLDDSASRCIDHGTMTMRLAPDGALEWSWSGQGQSAVARLRRVR